MSEGEGIVPHAPLQYGCAAGNHAPRPRDEGAPVLHSSNTSLVHFPADGLVAKVGTSLEAALTRELRVGVSQTMTP